MPLETATNRDAHPRGLREPAEGHPGRGDLDKRKSDMSGLSTGVEDDRKFWDIEKTAAEADVDKTAGQDIQPAGSPAVEVAKDPNLVEFDGPDDAGNPKNWTARRRIAITCSMGLMTFVVTFSSSIFAVAIEPVSAEFHIGTVTATLGSSLFLLGFVLGPVIFGPMSEVYGRKIPLFAGYAVFAIFQIPVAVAQNVETIMLGRFIAGFAASSPLAVVGGALADLWDPLQRAYAVCAFAAGAFTGPVAGPIIGGFVTESYL
jgi:MFS transporter, DHA1 family, multidrug resistance protein